MPSLRMAALAGLSLARVAAGHSWVEQLRNINDKGEYVGEYGYARGMVAKTDPGFDGNSMNYLLPQEKEKSNPWIGEESILCHPNQRKAKQSSEKYPRLQAVPGKFIAMRYVENGHTTLLEDSTNVPKPKAGGTIFVYGTTKPKEDEKLVDVLQWTQDGQGGDKRGFVVGMNNFDDGRCYEMPRPELATKWFKERQKKYPNFAMGQASDNAPGNMGLFCETDVKIPEDAKTGQPLTLYWVWQWNTMPGKDPTLPTGKSQYYTTCIDVDVVDTFKQDAKPKYPLGQQDAMSKAPADFASRTALYTNPIKAEPGPYFSKMGLGSGSGSSAAPAPPAAGTPSAPAAGSSKPAAAPTTLSTITSAAGSKPSTVADTKPSTAAGTKPSTAAGSKPSAPAGSKPTSPAAGNDDIPMMSTRPGRLQPTDAPASPSGKGNDKNDAVTVTDVIMVTVTAPAATATPRARRDVRHGAKFRGTSTSLED
ncbi:hypothetical protein CC80DRAFT_478591 [Byssothecium circinans]|uniref:DUF7492 domain-containing protein n=1 Tax=Byssothecium circinans TaxID=147558 RepID=A0A6A5TJ21_9PLEO|nr:hypothetical protein CC80DRAFT_478591 [Byssothecium circinans]